MTTTTKSKETRGRKVFKYRLSFEFLRGLVDEDIDSIIDLYNREKIGYDESLELMDKHIIKHNIKLDFLD